MIQIDPEFHVSRLHLLKDGGTLRAFCDVMVGGKMVVTGVKVVDGKNGIFVSMPRRQGVDGKWRDTVFPIDREARERLHGKILEAYQRASQN